MWVVTSVVACMLSTLWFYLYALTCKHRLTRTRAQTWSMQIRAFPAGCISSPMPPVCIDAGNDSSIAPVYLQNHHMFVRISPARPGTAVHFPSDTDHIISQQICAFGWCYGRFGKIYVRPWVATKYCLYHIFFYATFSNFDAINNTMSISWKHVQVIFNPKN